MRERSAPTSSVVWSRRIACGLGLVLLGGCAAVFPTSLPAPAQSSVTLSIVGTNDLHGGVLPGDDRGGVALLAGYMANLRAAREADGGAVLLIDAGDMFQGTLESNLTEGAVVVSAYNALGYAAAAAGNHEFDFGPEGPRSTPGGPGDDPRGALKARAAEARFPLLAANLIDEATGQPVDWPNVRPAVRLERSGITVGIIGVMTSVALMATTPANVEGLRIAPLADTIALHAERLRAEGADVVIVSAHAGGRCTRFDDPADLSSCDMAAEIVHAARALPAALVDVIVAGHVHAGKAHLVEEIAVISSYANGRAFGRVDLVVDRATGRVRDRRIFPPRDLCARVDPETGACAGGAGSIQAGYEGRVVAPDGAVAALLQPAVEAARALKAEPLGVLLETRIRRQAGADSPLGNLFADALRGSIPGADAALHNTTGGLRADLPSGPVVYGSIYDVMPFDTRVVPLRLTGADLRRVLARHLQRSGRSVGVAGMSVTATCSDGEVRLDLLRDTGTPIADDELLVVAVSDFLATGGDDILTPVVPPEGVEIPNDAPLARDALAHHLRARGPRLQESDFSGVRTTVPDRVPVTCR